MSLLSVPLHNFKEKHNMRNEKHRFAIIRGVVTKEKTEDCRFEQWSMLGHKQSQSFVIQPCRDMQKRKTTTTDWFSEIPEFLRCHRHEMKRSITHGIFFFTEFRLTGLISSTAWKRNLLFYQSQLLDYKLLVPSRTYWSIARLIQLIHDDLLVCQYILCEKNRNVL